jgi:uncharacterized membrane protein
VLEAALGIESKGAAATRGWFRIEPGGCRTVLRGELAADRLFLHARALPIYGSLRPLSEGAETLCIREGDFLIAAARQCPAPGKFAAFAEVKPRKTGDDHTVTIAESAEYDAAQARLAAVQRLLTLLGFDAEPIDGVDGNKSAAALAAFLKSKSLPADAAERPDLVDLLIAAARDGAGSGLLWCNETRYTVLAALGVEIEREVAVRGWWRVEAGACARPDLPRRRGGRIFSFAEAIDEQGFAVERAGKPLYWGGDKRLCTKNVRFDIRQHDDCEARGLDTKGFTMIDLPRESGTTVKFGE